MRFPRPARSLLFALIGLALPAVPTRADYTFTMTALDPPGTPPGPGGSQGHLDGWRGGSAAWGTSTNGVVAGQYGDGFSMHGYTLANGVFTTVDYPVGAASYVDTQLFAVNASGDLTGGFTLYDDALNIIEDSIFIRHDGVYFTPEIPGLNVNIVIGLNDSGLVAVQYA